MGSLVIDISVGSMGRHGIAALTLSPPGLAVKFPFEDGFSCDLEEVYEGFGINKNTQLPETGLFFGPSNDDGQKHPFFVAIFDFGSTYFRYYHYGDLKIDEAAGLPCGLRFIQSEAVDLSFGGEGGEITAHFRCR